jgi:hypothetical protein
MKANVSLSEDSLNISQLTDYVTKIFSLEKKLLERELKVTLLEFEVALCRNLISAFKNVK